MENPSLAQMLYEVGNLIDEGSGEIGPDLEAKFAEIVKKVDRCALFRDYARNRVEFLKSKAKEFEAAAKATENMVKGFETYLTIQLIQHGSLEGESFFMTLKKNPPALMITDLNSIPTEFYNSKSEVVLDKERIKLALKAGRKIPGVDLNQTNSLVIKPKRV